MSGQSRHCSVVYISGPLVRRFPMRPGACRPFPDSYVALVNQDGIAPALPVTLAVIDVSIRPQPDQSFIDFRFAVWFSALICNRASAIVINARCPIGAHNHAHVDCEIKNAQLSISEMFQNSVPKWGEIIHCLIGVLERLHLVKFGLRS
jgi:hypothetical protein